MRTVVYASSFVVSFAVLGAVSTAEGAILSSNLPAVNGSGLAAGQFSDAYLSNGSYHVGQSIATSFTVANSWNLTQLTFWGFSENAMQAGLGNVAGFQVRIMSSDFSTVVASQTWTLGQLAVQATGNIGTTGGIEYQFAGALGGTLNAGTYWLNIGFVAVNGNNDAWAWTSGMNNPTTMAAADSNHDGGWLPWHNTTQQFSGSHILFGQLVPGPGALSLLALGGMVGARRRRA